MNRLLATLLFVIAYTWAMNSALACTKPAGTGCQHPQGVGPKKVCRITCSALRYANEYFVCPSINWETNIAGKYCGIDDNSRARMEEEVTFAAAPIVPNAQLIADVKQACITAGCLLKTSAPRVVAPRPPVRGRQQLQR